MKPIVAWIFGMRDSDLKSKVGILLERDSKDMGTGVLKVGIK